MMTMEGNVFAKFSFSGSSRSAAPFHKLTKFSSETIAKQEVDEAKSQPQAGKWKKAKQENCQQFSGDEDRKLPNVLRGDPSSLDLYAPKVEHAELPEPGTIDVDDEEKYVLGSAASLQCDRLLLAADTATAPSDFTKEESLKVMSKLLSFSAHEQGTLRLNQEIEDCGAFNSSRTADSNDFRKKAVAIHKRPRKKGSQADPSAWMFPSNWDKAVQKIREMRKGQDAPVDLLGPEQLVDTKADSETQKFHVLVAAMISSQTRDAVTAAAMRRLHSMPGGLTIPHLADSDISCETLEELLKPVGFYRQKAKHLKGMAERLVMPPYCGSVPRKLDELMSLPGVGPKVGLLVLWVGFGMGKEGLIVDTNVRRVCCRLGWAPEGATAEQVREILEAWLPNTLWADVSFLFVGFGQQICKPVGPKCQECQLNSFCPSAFNCAKKVISQKRPSKLSSK